jgi:23S rRNA (uracil1939-C5)-methyltransferase
MLTEGEEVELAIDKPAAGGRMIARHQGQVILVSGAIPGEVIRARVERVERQLAFATTVHVLDASSDRRPAMNDPLCGGCAYSHIAYPRQRAIKADVIADAFARIGRMPLDSSLDVASSPERGYRMRARLHVKGGRAGFYREGTHDLCEAAATGQLLEESVTAAVTAARELSAAGATASSIEVADNLVGDQRAVHVTLASGTPPASALTRVIGPGVTGISVQGADGRSAFAGALTIADGLAALTRGRAQGQIHRSAASFFQANRFLLPDLVLTVLDHVTGARDVLDLYAGVGLFSLTLAGTSRDRITAVEGDSASGADLRRNATAFGSAVRVVVGSVEAYVSRVKQLPETVIVDPPRTGLSKVVVDALASRGGGRLIYVSCDPATMARDARRLVGGGWTLRHLQAFDLFPNTPHVECVGIFDR